MEGQTMKRTILAGTIMALAFTGIANAASCKSYKSCTQAVKQPGGKLPSTVPATRTSDAQIQENKDAAEIRLGSFFNPQPLQARTPPHRSSNL
jgi:hypothetical protein